jgi:site-specific DNA recombinase
VRAAIYVRVSTVAQELSPAAQEEQGRLYCRMKGYDVVAVFHEVGVSGGKEFASRAKGSELLARLGEFDVIVLSKLDRAFRSTVDCILTVERLRAVGKIIVFLDLSIDSSTPTGMLCLTMLAAFASFERQRIGERISEALGEVRSQGRKIGPAGYGFKNRARVIDGRKVDAGLQEPVANEAAALNLITSMRGLPLREIAAALKKAEIPTRKGGKWHPYTVAKVLRRMA